MLSELQFYDQEKAESDVQTLQEYYNQNGYHEAVASFDFEPDSVRGMNVLTFTINEDSLYRIKAITYKGFDSLPEFLSNMVSGSKIMKPGDGFDESKIKLEITTIHTLLLNNGYYYAGFDIPVVTKDTASNEDSVFISFYTGKRQKIDRIDFIDSTKRQKKVTDEMKKLQLEFEPGDWYSQNKVNRSVNNLMTLGTFDISNIDTSSIFKRKTDTSFSFLVFNQYRKQQEFGVSPYINKTTIDNFVNVGFEGSYLDRNMGFRAVNKCFCKIGSPGYKQG